MLPGFGNRSACMTRKSMATSRRARWRRPDLAPIIAGARRAAVIGFERVRSALREHPRIGGTAIALICIGVLVGLIPSQRDDAQPVAQVMPLTLPELQATIGSNESGNNDEGRDQTIDNHRVAAFSGIDEDQTATTSVSDWTVVEVRPGQTLERIFRDLGLSARLLHEVVNASEETQQLARIRPGDEFAFDLDEEEGFRSLRAEFDEENWLFVERGENGVTARTEPRELEYRVVETQGTITTSLYRAAQQANLSDNLTMRLANIFGWDIDFALEIRAGDRFALIYEQIWRDGEFLRDGPILAARFVNQGETFEAVRFDAGSGPDYFAPDGRPMRQAFLRAPLNFTRVTSNFNPRRFHPITRQVRPHNGTDYGAPTGTPVWAAGDGRVTRSGYNNRNGNYIFIQHGNSIETRYLHLSRRHVNVGERVRQGQTIGRVGATGMATGPHLHYEFLVNGAHRNPRTVDLPPADPLPDELLEQFRSTGQSLLARLDEVDQPALMLASADDACSQSGDSC
jgi:murein DD-endopeptidase MepM/ murein hydrolase activator NlpD